jgi:hypothetical protein
MDSLLIYAISADTTNVNSNFVFNKNKNIYVNISGIYSLIFNPEYNSVFEGKIDIDILNKLTEHKGDIIFTFSKNKLKLLGFLVEEATKYICYDLNEYYKDNIQKYNKYDYFSFDYELDFFYSRPIAKENYENKTVASFKFC